MSFVELGFVRTPACLHGAHATLTLLLGCLEAGVENDLHLFHALAKNYCPSMKTPYGISLTHKTPINNCPVVVWSIICLVFVSFTEILLFDSRPVSDYEYVNPTKCARIQQTSTTPSTTTCQQSGNVKIEIPPLIDLNDDGGYQDATSLVPPNRTPSTCPTHPPPPPPRRPQNPLPRTVLPSRGGYPGENNEHTYMSKPMSGRPPPQQQRLQKQLSNVETQDIVQSARYHQLTAEVAAKETGVGAVCNKSGSDGIISPSAYGKYQSSNDAQRTANEYQPSSISHQQLINIDQLIRVMTVPDSTSRSVAAPVNRLTSSNDKAASDDWNISPLKNSPIRDADKPVRQMTQDCKLVIARDSPLPCVPIQVVNPLRTPNCPSSIIPLYSDHAPVGESSTSNRSAIAEQHPKNSLSSSAVESKFGWQTVADVPLDVEDFTVEQVCRTLKLLCMPKLAATFEEQSIDGQLMMSIVTEESLIEDFRCSRFEARKLILFFKNKWRPK